MTLLVEFLVFSLARIMFRGVNLCEFCNHSIFCDIRTTNLYSMGYFQKFLVILMCLYNFIDSNVCIVIRRICFIQLEQNIAYVQPDFSEIIADIYIFFLFFFFEVTCSYYSS